MNLPPHAYSFLLRNWRSGIHCTAGMLIAALLFCSSAFSQERYREKYRPSYHFTPAEHWINDPNGLIYLDGEYHMFYQYNPYGNVWGHMHWGHAISKDLVHWNELPPAISESGDTMIFSGSAVIDKNNSSGFATKAGQVPMVAIYTGHIEQKSQSQHLAYSLDKGRTWTRYKGNPVLDLGTKEFRDPKVFWYEPEKKWVMAVVLPLDRKTQFYSSKDLKAWTLMSSFGPAGDTSGIWECPDLFRVPVAGSPGKYKWVLMLSPAPYMQYFVGDFDGNKFTSENPASVIYRPDYGPDYYAAIVFNNLPAGSLPTSIGWINNWKYANEIPVSPWKGAMSLPRELQLKQYGKEWLLVQQPVKQVRQLMKEEKGWKNISTKNAWVVEETKGGSFAAEIILRRNQQNKVMIDIAGSALTFTYDDVNAVFSVHRGGNSAFQNEEYKKLSDFSAPLKRGGETLRIQLFFDQSIAEVFVNGGEVAMTAQLFPEKENLPMTVSSSNGTIIPSVKCWQMQSAWNKK